MEMELGGVTQSLSREIYLAHQTFIHSNHTKCASTSHEMGQIGVFCRDFGRSVDGMDNSPADTFGKRYGEVLLVSQATVELSDLPELGARLQLPDGWSYRTSTLISPLSVDTTIDDAHVTQDNFGNTYSLAPA